MTVPRPAWAAEIKDWERFFEKHSDHGYHIFQQLCHYAAHSYQAFDLTFYDREPVLEATLDSDWARKFHAAILASDTSQTAKLLRRVTLSTALAADGAFIHFEHIWTINYIPSDLNAAGVDLAQGEEIAGFGGESVRHMIGKTYRCQSRAEEDFFLARWIAS